MERGMSGNGRLSLLHFTEAPKRVVSLVPSLTDSVIDLGAGKYLVGITDYCPAHMIDVKNVTRVGGPKDFDIEVIKKLNPELVLANQEENQRDGIEELEDSGVKVWVTFPRTVDDALQLLWTLVRLFRVEEFASPRVRTLEVTLEWTTRAALGRPPVRVFCPIWQEDSSEHGFWWMTFNMSTYANDLLYHCGGLNVFAGRERRYPILADLGQGEAEEAGERDTRYPRVSPDEVISQDPEVILLPSEPFVFGEDDMANALKLLKGTSAEQTNRVHLVEGSLITWHGTRMAQALAELPTYLQPL
jgi:ABC-type Fe3+-hydroxamate transport system substrate-binding protein